MADTWNVLVAQKHSNLVQRFQKIFQDSPSRYNGKIVKIFCATTGSAAQKILLENDIHLSFIGVSLEQVDSGLAVVNFIRTQLNNHEARVILIIAPGENFAPSWASDFYNINGIKTADQLLQDKIIRIEVVMQIHDFANSKKIKNRLIAAENNNEALLNQGKSERKVKDFLTTILTDYIPVPVILAGSDGIVVRFNKAAEAFFSVPAKNVLGFEFSKIALDLGIGHGYRDVIEGFARGINYRQSFTRVVRGETITMTFAFEAMSVSVSSKVVIGYSMIGDTAILSSEINSTGVAPELPIAGCLPEIHTISQNMLEVSEQISKLSKSSVTALLVSKSGVGREFFARIIHKHSSRKHKTFIAVNCTIVEDKLDDELFGSEDYPKSVFEKCDGGTLFLANVQTMTPKIQNRLLGFLIRRGFYHNVTGDFIESDVRLIVSMGRMAAYNISDTGFNEDLFYRLSATLLYLPSVAERKADIPLLMRTFLELHRCPILEMTDSFVKAIVAYDWPGNIREMVTTAQMIAMNKTTDKPIDVVNLPVTIRWQASKGIMANFIFASKTDIPKSEAEAMLRQVDGNMSRAAEALGVSRTTLYRILEKDSD